MIAPTTKKERISSIDALRGFALLGILLANLPFNGNGKTSESDEIVQFLYHLLLDNKFISIFSMLFGFGFYIQMKRMERIKTNFSKYLILRMGLLFIIGCLHAYILWNGDILRAYALGGIFLLLVRNWPVKRLLILAVVFNVFLTGFIHIGNTALDWRIYNYDYNLASEHLLTKNYFRYLEINAIMDPWTNFFKDMPITLAFTFGNMLIGLIMGKSGFINLPKKFNKLTTWLIILGCSLGIASSYVYHEVIIGNISLSVSLFWLPFLLVAGMVLQSLFYFSAFLWLYNARILRNFLNLFNSVGRMALTNYILQSVFYLFIFFHCTHGLQLFGKLDYFQTYLLGIPLFAIQVILSNWWMNRKKQGPLEYIWKRISYRFACKYQLNYSLREYN